MTEKYIFRGVFFFSKLTCACHFFPFQVTCSTLKRTKRIITNSKESVIRLWLQFDARKSMINAHKRRTALFESDTNECRHSQMLVGSTVQIKGKKAL